MLIKETGYIGQGGAVEYNYIDEDGENVQAVVDDLYDEVNDKQNRPLKGYDGKGRKMIWLAAARSKLQGASNEIIDLDWSVAHMPSIMWKV